MKVENSWGYWMPQLDIEREMVTFAERRCLGLLRFGQFAPITKLLASAYLQGMRDVADTLAHKETNR